MTLPLTCLPGPLALFLIPGTVAGRIISLRAPDVVIIVVYFAMVLGIGFYLKGWAGSAYQYGILATHWYWVGAIPAMLCLGIVMMPFYYISKTHSVPGYLQLRYGEGARALSAVSFALMTVLMSGINMFSMALVMKSVLGWNMTFSILVSSVTVAVYVALGGLYSAIFNEVLQFFLIWLGALLIPILGLIEAGGWTGLVGRIRHNFPQQDYTHMWRTLGSFSDNPM